jgi:hypothetical protein
MPDLIPVDHDPFASPTLIPVDHDPFAGDQVQVPPQEWRLPDLAALTGMPSALEQSAAATAANPWQPGMTAGQVLAGRPDDPLAGSFQPGVGVGAIKAFHGSPYDFERFDMSKIGTGEGAQAYGHGLYFAGNEPTAAYYRGKLSPSGVNIVGPDGSPIITGGALRDATAANAISAQLRDAGVGGEPYMRNSIAQSWLSDPGSQLDADSVFKRAFGNERIMGMDQKTIDDLRSLIGQMTEKAQPILNQYRVEKPGRMYEARINADPEHFLDWDKPLSQQSEKVKEALAPHYGEVTTRSIGQNPHLGEELHDLLVNGQSIGAFPASALQGKDLKSLAMQHDPRTGAGLYDELANDLRMGSMTASGGRIEAADALREAGVPGIRYLDQGSRGAGEGTHNYVVFSDDIIDIIKKYGLAGLIAGGAMAIPGEAGATRHLIPVEHDPFAGVGP